MTQLPEPNFIERDADKITQEWIDLYESKSGKTLQPAQIERLMIDIGAYRENILRIKIQETAKQNLLSYADLDMLQHIGEPLGVSQLKADSATVILKFSLDEALDFDYAIPQGTEVETKDGLFIFETINASILNAGELNIEVEAICQSSGSAGNNYTVGSINNLITPLGYISAVSNITVSAGGADDENADNLRERIRQAPEKFSNAGSRGAYKYHTLSAHQSIIDIAVLSPSPGVVQIYPLTSSGNPNEEILSIVQEYLNDDKIRPLTDYVQVLSPEKIEFEITANIVLYTDADETSVMSIINARLNEYRKSLAKKLGKDVIHTQIISILNNIYGVFKVELSSPNDIDILENQWADLTNFDITIGGFANE